MTLVPVMWLVWGVLALLFVLLKVYTGRLSRDESDQIVLDEAFEHFKSENDAIIAKVGRVEGVSRIVMWALAAMTLVVVVYYLMDMVHQFQ
jgi:uncharacterized membrane protein YjfL (UPF0719 family)